MKADPRHRKSSRDSCPSSHEFPDARLVLAIKMRFASVQRQDRSAMQFARAANCCCAGLSVHLPQICST